VSSRSGDAGASSAVSITLVTLGNLRLYTLTFSLEILGGAAGTWIWSGRLALTNGFVGQIGVGAFPAYALLLDGAGGISIQGTGTAGIFLAQITLPLIAV
jgi:hypothetical protein